MTDGLKGCWAKIDRARRHLVLLEQDVTEFINTNTQNIQLTCSHSVDGLELILSAKGLVQVPMHFSIVIGEIVHQLRSSLDHLLHALIVQAGNIPNKRNQFPICTSREAYDEQIKQKRISGVSSRASQLIEQAQPFQGSPPEDTITHVVSQLNNLDKHNALVVSAAAATTGETITIGVNEEIAKALGRIGAPPAIIGLGDPSPKKLSSGSVDIFKIQLGTPAPELTASSQIALDVVIEVDGTGRIFPAIKLLEHLILGITNTLKSFEPEFQ